MSVNDVGLEFDGYISYMLYKNVEVAINAGYLLAGDAMDYWEEDSIQNGSSDENIFKSGCQSPLQVLTRTLHNECDYAIFSIRWLGKVPTTC